MTNRLSQENQISIYHQGHRAFDLIEKSLVDLVPAIDIQKMLLDPQGPKLIRALEPQILYMSMKRCGLSDCQDIIEHLSRDQFVRLFDYDVWAKDDLNPKQAFQWLSLCHKVSQAHMVSRFRSLDEEYQVSLLNSLVVAYDQTQYETFGSTFQDRLYPAPGNQLYYDILTDDDFIRQTLTEFIESSFSQDIGYTMSLLALVTYTPPNETELLLQQFRRARLEEDGFVTAEEGHLYFVISAKNKRDFPKIKTECSSEIVSLDDNELLFEKLLLQSQEINSDLAGKIKTGFLQLSNAMCAVTQVEPDDIASLRHLMVQIRGMINLALELCASTLDESLELLKSSYMKTLFQSSLSHIQKLQENVITKLEKYEFLQLGKLRNYMNTLKYGLVLDLLDKNTIDCFGSERIEILKGLFNRFPMAPVFSEENGVKKLRFKPVERVSELHNLVATVESYFTLLDLALKFSGKSFVLSEDNHLSLDEILLKSLCAHLVGKDILSGYDFTKEDLDQLVLLSSSAKENKKQEFIKTHLDPMDGFSTKEIELYFQQIALMVQDKQALSNFLNMKTQGGCGVAQ